MSQETLELQEVLNSKIYMKENSAIAFNSPKEYLGRFLDIVTPLGAEISVKVAEKVANKNDLDDNINIAYGRVAIEAKLPSNFDIVEHSSVIGLVYALDTTKPIMKVYSGKNAWACTNLSIFNTTNVFNADMVNLTQIAECYNKIQQYSNNMESEIEGFRRKIETLRTKIYSGNELDQVLGDILRQSIRNKGLGTTPILYATQELENPNSKYFAREGASTAYNLYNALTQYLTEKSNIIDKPTKTLLVESLFSSLVTQN